jgi:hypothetical protein
MNDKPTLPYGDAEYVQETARRIATHELMIADLSNHAWQISLALMISKIAEYDNAGLILVPKGPHIGLHWINNTAPGCTLSCQLVAEQDLEALQLELDKIHAVLYPQQQQGATMTIKVNNIEWEAGCVVDGDVHGQYSDDRLADIAIAYGLELNDDTDPRHWRALINESAEQGDAMEDYFGEQLEESSTKLIELLNANTVGGHFEWTEGSVFLVADDDDDDQ